MNDATERFRCTPDDGLKALDACIRTIHAACRVWSVPIPFEERESLAMDLYTDWLSRHRKGLDTDLLSRAGGILTKSTRARRRTAFESAAMSDIALDKAEDTERQNRLRDWCSMPGNLTRIEHALRGYPDQLRAIRGFAEHGNLAAVADADGVTKSAVGQRLNKAVRRLKEAGLIEPGYRPADKDKLEGRLPVRPNLRARPDDMPRLGTSRASMSIGADRGTGFGKLMRSYSGAL